MTHWTCVTLRGGTRSFSESKKQLPANSQFVVHAIVAYISLADYAHYATYTNNNIKFHIASNAQY